MRRTLTYTLTLGAVLALLAAYYWAHKPITLPQAAAFLALCRDLLSTALVAAVSGGVGRRLLRSLRLERLTRAERIALEGTIGLGGMGLVGWALGMIGAYTSAAIWMTLLGLTILTFPALFGWLSGLWRAINSALQTANTAWLRLIAGFATLFTVTAAMHALAPPLAWDSLAYHLSAPQTYLAEGRIAAHPENAYFGFPQNAEVVYGLAVGMFGSDSAAAPIHFLFGMYGIMLGAGYVRRQTTVAAGWLAGLLPLTAYSLWLLMGWAYVDLALFAYGTAALVALGAWRDGEKNQGGRWLVAAGVYAGFAFATKYTGAGLILAVITVVIFTTGRDYQAIFRRVALIGAIITLIYLPWAIKGMTLYGNPVYPLVFNGLNWDAERTRTFATAEVGLVERGGLWQLPMLPLAATVFGVEKSAVLPGGSYFFTAGAWLLALPLLLIGVWRWIGNGGRAAGRTTFIFAAPILLFWAVAAVLSPVGMQTRLMSMGFGAAAILGGITFHGLVNTPRKPFDVGFIVRALFLLTLVFHAVELVDKTMTDGVPAYLLNGDRPAYLTRNMGSYTVAMAQLATLPPGSIVRLMWEPRGFYCPAAVRCLPDVLLDHWVRALGTGTPETVFAQWQAAGEGYLLVHDAGLNFYIGQTGRFLTANRQFREAVGALRLIWSDGMGGYTLYGWQSD